MEEIKEEMKKKRKWKQVKFCQFEHHEQESKTTVYNTLKQLVDCGLVQTVTIEDGELRFDADISNHLHFKCTKCGEVFDVFKEINLPEDLLPEGFAISKMQTNLWGLCANCN